MNELGINLMKAMDRVFTPPPPKDAAAETTKAVIGSKTICDPADKEKIIELDQKHAAAYQIACASGYANAKQAHAVDQRRQEALFTAGQFDGADFWSLPDFVQDFQQRQTIAKRQMFAISVAAAAICKPICATVARLLLEKADAIDRDDQEMYARYAVTFTPGPLSARLRTMAAQVLQRVSSGGGSRPKTYCPFLFE